MALLLAGALVPLAQGQAPHIPLITQIPATARAAGLAGAYTAVLGDAGAVFVSASSVVLIRRVGLEGSTSWLPHSGRQSSLAGAVRLGQFHLAGGYQTLSLPEGAPMENNTLWVANAVYRFGLFAVSAGVKSVGARDTTGTTLRATKADVSALLAMFDIAALAVSVQNIGSRPDSGPALDLPPTTRLGLMLNVVDPQGTGRLMGTLDVVWTEGFDRRTILGGEAGLVFNGFGALLRVGYGAESPLTGSARWAVGGSVVLGPVNVDYAYRELANTVGDTHRIGIRVIP